MGAPFMIRNESAHPYLPKVGYKRADDYWNDASSFKFYHNTEIPLLVMTAKDDFLVSTSMKRVLHCILRTPNAIVVESKTGGHLGWFCEDGIWADLVVCNFVDALLNMKGDDDALFADKGKREHRVSPKLSDRHAQTCKIHS